jgi:nitrogen regulatory protein PII
MGSDGLSLLVAYIQPFQLEAVVDALRALPGFPGMTVSEVRGFGAHLAHPPHPGESTEVQPFKPKVRLEIACATQEVGRIVEELRTIAHTGHPGDGKILVIALADAVRVRTGERGADALLSRRGT